MNHFSRQYQDFLEDLEEDEALRKNVNIFRGEDAILLSVHPHAYYLYTCAHLHSYALPDASKIPVESDTDDEGVPRISLAEMMDDLSLNDATGGEGADMMTD